VEAIVRDSRAGLPQVLLGDDSTPRTVQPGTASVHHGHLFRVRYANDKDGGDSWTCNAAHILVLKLFSEPMVQRQEDAAAESDAWEARWIELEAGVDDAPELGQRSWRPVEQRKNGFASALDAESFLHTLSSSSSSSTSPLHFECTVRDFLSLPTAMQRRCVMYQPDVVQFPPPGLPLHARLQSALADVGHATTLVTPELLRQTARRLGVYLSAAALERSHSVPSSLVQPALVECFSAAAPDAILHNLLSSYDVQPLLARKRIPHALLQDSLEVRTALLTGLLDSADECEESCSATGSVYVLRSSHHEFLLDARHLMRGLGYSAGSVLPSSRGGHAHGTPRAAFELRVCVDALSRVLEFQSFPAPKLPRATQAAARCTSFDLTPCGVGAFFGFQLDGNQRALLSDYTVTHNSQIQAEPYHLKTPYKKHPLLLDGGFISCWKHVVKEGGGQRALWKGFGTCAARAFPANAAGFLAYEMGLRLLRDIDVA
jgi:hypothetical protein